MSSTSEDIRRPAPASTRAGGPGTARGGPVARAARRGLAALRRIPLSLALVLVVAALHATAWAVVIAPVNGPDEEAHIAYTQQLAETRDAPQRETGDRSLSTWLSTILRDLQLKPIQGHVEARPAWELTERTEREVAALPEAAREDGNGPNAAAANPPLYYVYASVAWTVSPDRSPLGQIFFTRLASVLLFVLAVAFAYLFASELFVRQWPRTVTALLMALHPKAAMVGGIINPDVLLITFGSMFLWAGARIIRRGPTVGGVALLAGATAGNVLTHGRGLYVVPVALLLGVYLLWRHRPQVRDALRLIAIGSVPVLLGLLITYAWTRSHSGGSAYGGQVGLSPSYNLREFFSYLWQFYFPKLGFMDPKVGGDYGFRQVYVDSFYGAIGYLEVNFSLLVYDLLKLGVVLGFVALYTTAVARWRLLRDHWPVVTFTVLTFLSLMALVHTVSYQSLAGGVDPIITGRYLFPLLALYGAAMAFVAGSLPRRLGAPFAGALVGVHLMLALGALGLALTRFYV